MLTHVDPPWRAAAVSLRLRSLVLKNRIYVPAHSYGFVDSGRPTADFIPYLRARLDGGVSLIVLGETIVPDMTTAGNQTWGGTVSGPSLERFYERAAGAASRRNSHIFEQLYHPGGQVWQTPGAVSYAPSRIHHSTSAFMPWVLGASDIARVISEFGSAARRAVTHGIAGVELKADQGKLHHQFLSPRFNKRDDLYGMGRGGGTRFLRETLIELRESIGDAAVIGVRLPTSDGWESAGEGLEIRDLPEWVDELLPELASWGVVDYISLSHGTNSTRVGYRLGHSDVALPHFNAHRMAGKMRNLTALPLFVSSNIRSLAHAGELIREGAADMVGMVRATIADPEIVNKTFGGRDAEIRPCTSSNQGCVGNTWVGRPLRCTVNPEAGRERRVAGPARRSKLHIGIVGGGPSGLEAAMRLGRAGCTVTVYERSPETGGQIQAAQRVSGREGFGAFLEYLERQLLQLETVKILRNSEISRFSDLRSEHDAVIVATGSTDPVPWSVGFEELLSPINALPKWLSPAEVLLKPPARDRHSKVLVVDMDWTQSSLGIAADFAKSGRSVVYATAMETPGGELDYVTQTVWLGELRRREVQVLTSVETYAADEGLIVLRDIIAGNLIEVNDVSELVMAVSRDPSVSAQYTNGVGNLMIVGDARFPRGLEFALRDAVDAAQSLLRPLRKGDDWSVIATI